MSLHSKKYIFTILTKRLSESALPPPSMCWVKFEFEFERGAIGIGRWGVYVGMPEEDEGIILYQVANADCYSEDD